MRIIATAAAVIALTAAGLVGAPEASAHHVTCFIHAIGPSKTGGASNAPIAFGYQVACDGRPDVRTIEYSLMRRDRDGKARVQTVGRDKDTDPAKTEMFYSECGTSGQVHEYYTYVSMLGGHGTGTPDFTDDTSSSTLLAC